MLAVCLDGRFALGLETGESKRFALGCECVCVCALSLDKPQSGATDAASCTLLQQERKNKKMQKR